MQLSCDLPCSYLCSSIRMLGLAFLARSTRQRRADNQRRRGITIVGFRSCWSEVGSCASSFHQIESYQYLSEDCVLVSSSSGATDPPLVGSGRADPPPTVLGAADPPLCVAEMRQKGRTATKELGVKTTTTGSDWLTSRLDSSRLDS
jgi:hypothetical protein